MKIEFAWVFVLMLSSCTVQQRAARKMRKACDMYPALCDTSEITRDTTYQIDTFATLDTSYIVLPSDTIEIVSEKVFTRIVREHDTLTVYQEIEPDTVTQIKEVQTIKYKASPVRWWLYGAFVVQIGLAFLLFNQIRNGNT